MTSSHVLTPEINDDTVTAEPTKWFFVDMLVRDVALIPAIADLVDNAVDAARKLRPMGDFSGLRINVEASGEFFRVSDNCGGMDLDVARKYAFRFGRDPDRPLDERTIGQFGVGMKRTLFKIGHSFSVEAATQSNSFLLEVDVDAWLSNPVWAFELTRKSEGDDRAEEATFTTVEVRDLYPDVASDMAAEEWLSSLAEELRQKHRQSIDAVGNVASSRQIKSSGYAAYDAVLVQGLSHWRYRPYTLDGRGIPVCSVVTFLYAMK